MNTRVDEPSVNHFRLMIFLQALILAFQASLLLYVVTGMQFFYYLGYPGGTFFVNLSDNPSILVYTVVFGHRNLVFVYLGIVLLSSSHNEFAMKSNLLAIFYIIFGLAPLLYFYLIYTALINDNFALFDMANSISGLSSFVLPLLIFVSAYRLPRSTIFQQIARRRASWVFLLYFVTTILFLFLTSTIFSNFAESGEIETIIFASGLSSTFATLLSSVYVVFLLLGLENAYFETSTYPQDQLIYPKGAEIYG